MYIAFPLKMYTQYPKLCKICNRYVCTLNEILAVVCFTNTYHSVFVL